MTATDRDSHAVEDEDDRFVFTDGESVAELTYLQQSDALILLHTGVPASLEGQGIGGDLVRAAVDRAAREDLTIVPWCAFARRWLRDHPDVAGRVTIDWATRDTR